jgi:transcriptional regulator with XRE-family HTH domain
MNLFKLNISHLRGLKKMTQSEFAKFLGVKSPSISNWELGYSYPTMELLFQFRIIFNLSLDELLVINLKDRYSNNELLSILNDQSKKEAVVGEFESGERQERIKTEEEENISSLAKTISEMSSVISVSNKSANNLTESTLKLSESTLRLTEANIQSSNTIDNLIKLISEK